MCTEARVRTDVVMLRTKGRKMAIEAAIMPVPGSAVAHMVARMVIAVNQAVSLVRCK